MKSHSIIKQLSDKVINQIKAGEVIERPLNVVKELVENALDASANQITIELLDGGKKLIQISDNGIGIPKEDISIAIQRHTTSKLENFEDLETLNSFGFRGEALASISNVSDFSIKTKVQNADLGTLMTISPNNNPIIHEVPMNTGTVITIKNLFCNVPARLKFLRSTPTEFALIHDLLRAISFSVPHVSIQLNHNGRQVFHYLAKSSLHERFIEIMGEEAKDYVKVDFQHGSFNIFGFTILPSSIKSAQNTITTFVNNRLIKDKFLRSSIYSGYQGLLMKGVKPSAMLFIQIDSKSLDINAHPAKTEIRFLDPLMVQDLVGRSIEHALKSSLNDRVYPINRLQFHHDTTSKTRSQTPSDIQRYANLSRLTSPLISSPKPQSLAISSIPQETADNHTLFTPPVEDRAFSGSKFLGQYLNCFLFFEIKSDLWVIDQHAFHERILFEELKTSYQISGIQKQSFLNPVIIPIDVISEPLYLEHTELFSKLGFEIEILKNTTLAIHSAPTFLSEQKIKPVFIKISEELNEQKNSEISSIYHDCFATIACHSAIRSGDPLSSEFVEKLMNRAQDVDFFAHCPHGRPVIRKFSKNDVERWFERI